MDSVEFFLSDKPHRLYNEFGKSKAAREDFRLRHLNQTPGVFDRAISKWLEADSKSPRLTTHLYLLLKQLSVLD